MAVSAEAATAQTSFIVTPAADGQLRLGNTIAALTNLRS